MCSGGSLHFQRAHVVSTLPSSVSESKGDASLELSASDTHANASPDGLTAGAVLDVPLKDETEKPQTRPSGSLKPC